MIILKAIWLSFLIKKKTKQVRGCERNLVSVDKIAILELSNIRINEVFHFTDSIDKEEELNKVVDYGKCNKKISQKWHDKMDGQ